MYRFLFFNFLLATILISCNTSKSSQKPPNIIYILADDLGYGDLGCYGQKIIETPHIDRLASEGMLFTNHYSGSPVCAPSRSVLLTGLHTGHTPIRGNDEWSSRGKVWDLQEMYADSSLEGQRPLPEGTLLISELLQNAGYKTGIVGKWGLGAPHTNSIPNKKGFDFFLGYNCQRIAHTLYPMHLWKNEEKLPLKNKFVPIHTGFPADADPQDANAYSDFQLEEFAPDVMHEGAMEFITDNKDSSFFLYYASPLPHLPLQAPQKWIDHYKEKIGPEEPYTGKSYYPTQFPRATYAAMISALDEQVGDIMELLDSLDIADNTIIMFSSDNGATYTGGADTEYFRSNAPYSAAYGYGKGFVREGGIKVPMVARWPENITPDVQNQTISSFQDVLPTICEIAGIQSPSNIDGISLLPSLTSQGQQKDHPYLYWEFPAYGGQQAIRMGKWKAIRKDIKKGNLTLELYDLERDPVESKNVATENPEIIAEMEAIMTSARTLPQNRSFYMPALGDSLSTL